MNWRGNKNGHFLARIWDILSTVIVMIVVCIAVVLVELRIKGYQAYTVLSGSMEPSYRVGSLVYVKPVNTADLRVGDVISFMANSSTIVTHRIVDIVEKVDASGEEITFYKTKGDANNDADGSLVHEQNVLGLLRFSIPLLGYFSYSIQRPPGLYIMLFTGMALIITVFMPSVEKETRKGVAIRKKTI